MGDEHDDWLVTLGVQPDSFDNSLGDNSGVVLTSGGDDPFVGQGKVVDPNDKGFGLKGTWDVDQPPKVTGVYGDLPKVGPVDPKGDPLDSTADSPSGKDPSTPTQFPQPKTPGPPGAVWNPVLRAWVTVAPAGIPVPPAPPPPEPGDYNVPDDDTANA
jgi:hypothetical protein